MDKTIGRPPKKRAVLSKDVILKLALRLIDERGDQAVSFRSLAKELNVTAMAVSHHVGTRHEMLSSLCKFVYRGVAQSDTASTPEQQLRTLLNDYCRRTFKHPNVTKLMLTDPSLMTEELTLLTDRIRLNIAALGAKDEALETVVNLVVDFTHGFAFSAAFAGPQYKSTSGLTTADFNQGLDWILLPLKQQVNP